MPISRLTATLCHPLSTLHDARCRTPCKTRFRLAGCAFAGRESNPLENKPPPTAWGEVLHDNDLAEAIVDRVLERGRLLLLDGPSYRTARSSPVSPAG